MYESIISKQNLISLNENTHTYTLQNSDIEFSSVAEFIGRFFKTFDEQKVAEKLSKMSKYKGQTVNQILENWNNRKERGTIVHKEIETVILQANQNAKFDTKELIQFIVPEQDLCVDNATMIAWAAIERLQINKKGDILDFEPKPRWALEKL